VMATHGDGLTENRWHAHLLHRVIQHPATARIYRFLHPELGFRLVDMLSPALGDHTMDEATLARASARQRNWAESYLKEDPSVGLVIMGHTHHATIAEPCQGRQYLNPGAWFDGLRYAIATETGARLCSFEPTLTVSPPPFPTAHR
jgi:UDP-2,3-diacylglucosamine pyrophosphatase LpxH